MASCIETLAIAGSRKSDGSVNAGGIVYLTQPGSANSPVVGYADVAKSAALPLSSGGYLLDGAGKVAIFVEDPCSIRVTDTTGATVDTMSFGVSTNAGLVEVTTPGWTGINSGGSATSGSQTYLDTVLANIYASVGGLDGKFRGVYGINDTNIKDEIERLALTPQRFGAKGDGVTDDSTAWLNLAAAQSASGIPVFVPKGTYKISQVVTFGAGAVITGVSKSSTIGSIVLCTNAAQNGIVAGSQSTIQNLAVLSLAGSAGIGITVTQGTLINVAVNASGGGSFLSAVSSSNISMAISCNFAGSTNATVGSWTLLNHLGVGFAGAVSSSTQYAGTIPVNTQTVDIANGGSTTVPSPFGSFAGGMPAVSCRVRGTSAGGGTVSAQAGNLGVGLLAIDCFNNSGGAYLFTFSAPLRSTGTANPSNGNHLVVTFAWNQTDSLWIECGRTSTAAGI